MCEINGVLDFEHLILTLHTTDEGLRYKFLNHHNAGKAIKYTNKSPKQSFPALQSYTLIAVMIDKIVTTMVIMTMIE